MELNNSDSIIAKWIVWGIFEPDWDKSEETLKELWKDFELIPEDAGCLLMTMTIGKHFRKQIANG